MNSPDTLADDLRAHLDLCRQLLAIIEAESHALRETTAPQQVLAGVGQGTPPNAPGAEPAAPGAAAPAAAPSSSGRPSLRDCLQARKGLLPRLDESLHRLRMHCGNWRSLGARERAQQQGIASLLRQTQETILKVILLDRDNEQGYLRRGLVPAKELASLPRRRPGCVAERYRRQAA